ncbi:hypothetical protein L208DRAFT_1550295, partial [Tricholoma matsutake]
MMSWVTIRSLCIISFMSTLPSRHLSRSQAHLDTLTWERTCHVSTILHLCINFIEASVFSYMHGIAKSEAKNPGSSVDAVYHIKEKEGCSTKVTAFFRMADQECKRTNRSKRRHLKLANPPMPKLSELTALLKKVPIDWFDPIYWNNLSIHEHAQYVKNGTYVALPPAELCASWDECEKWKSMPEKEFM